MVIPRSLSISILSTTCCLPLISRSVRPPVAWISRSASVDLPWSMCAMMLKFLILLMSVMCRRAIVAGQKGAIEMKRVSVLAIAAMTVGAAPAAKDPPPIANYWMDVATASGMGPGMSAAQIMSAMSGGGGAVMHTLDRRLASGDRAPAPPAADHLIPPGLHMG